ncbi:MAG: tryptophan-rich sensory protein [Candidatus Shapirobacteria bacterium]|nr:tryptophan-rich sensory protein [Candidatus Shapirobacteria bacterium]
MKNWKRLLISIFICQLAGIIGSFFTTGAINTWYIFLEKPSFAPPNWLFAPVWISLYTLMGVSFYLVWQSSLGKKEHKAAINLFLVHLVFNSAWSIIFFGAQEIGLALLEILLLLVLLVAVIVKFYQIDKKAALLLLPYFVWVSFASFLNYQLWVLNR